MPYKITKLKFIEALENNNEGLTVKELSEQLNISIPYFYKLRKQYRNEIVDAAKEYCKSKAIDQVKQLEKQSNNGTTVATNSMLEISKVKTKDSLIPDDDKNWKITIEKIAPDKQGK